MAGVGEEVIDLADEAAPLHAALVGSGEAVDLPANGAVGLCRFRAEGFDVFGPLLQALAAEGIAGEGLFFVNGVEAPELCKSAITPSIWGRKNGTTTPLKIM